jgi:TIR domain-containing protein
MVEVWDDTKIAVGARWKDDIQRALERAAVAIVLVSADFLASSFILEFELPKVLQQAEFGGTAMHPIIVSHCLYESSRLKDFQSVNPPNKPLIAMSTAEQEQTLVSEALSIQNVLKVKRQ